MRLVLGVWEWTAGRVKGAGLFCLLRLVVHPSGTSTVRTHWQLVGKREIVVCWAPA